MGKIFDRIYSEVKKIPKGKTSSYKEIAKRAKTIPKVVGYALSKNKDPKNIPCHRVVYKDGSCSKGYAFGGRKAQEKKLKEESDIYKKIK